MAEGTTRGSGYLASWEPTSLLELRAELKVGSQLGFAAHWAIPTGCLLRIEDETISDPSEVALLTSALAGRYEVQREIGAGGMATVYLARDVKHNRNVALKVLKPELGAVLGVERFLSEIRVTANLQHPNLLPLFDSGEASGLLFYVMPFVEGETLRARLDREKQLPVDEALRIAIAVAGALDYAHSHGVIHRDLKPENILLQHGQPVLADFGIALAVANAGGTRITQTGLSLGTPQYMSPEQATGDRVIDGRTDIYSLGAVLYEMLTGDPPHTGSTAQAIIARVLTERPRSIRATRERVPEYVEAAIGRALAKLSADRFATARDFANALSGQAVGGFATDDSVAERPMTFTVAMPRVRPRSVGKVVLALALLAAAGWGWLRPAPVAPSALRAQFVVTVPDSFGTREDLTGENIAISPDGTQIVFAGGAGAGLLMMRGLNELEAHPIPGTREAFQPRFSPDGRWLSFIVGTTLRKIPLAGGPAATIAENVNRYSWGEGNIIIADYNSGESAPGVPNWGFRIIGGPPGNPLPLPDTARKEAAYTWPCFLPGGKAILFIIMKGGPETATLAAMRLSDRKIIRFDSVTGLDPRYVASGHVLLGHLGGTVDAIPFDPVSLEITGPPLTALENVHVKGGGASEFAVSASGTLAYVQGTTDMELVMVDRAGSVRVLTPERRRFLHPRLSPAGDRVAVEVSPEGNEVLDIWTLNVSSRQLTRLTSDGMSVGPEWSRDGSRVYWTSGKSERDRHVWTQSWDGRGQAVLVPTPGHSFNSVVPSPLGDVFASSAFRGPRVFDEDIWVTPIAGGSGSRMIVGNSADEYLPRISPDGKWVAYIADTGAGYEVFVSPVTAQGGAGAERHQISTGAGREGAVWGPSGLVLYYRAGGRMLEARIKVSPQFEFTTDNVFVDVFAHGNGQVNFDTRDGKHFVMLRSIDEQERLVVVTGWLDALRERMAQGPRK